MCPHHHHFVPLGVARNLGDDIERPRIVVVKLGLHIEGELDWKLVIQQPRDAIILLRREHDGGDIVIGLAVRAQTVDQSCVTLARSANHQRHTFVLPKTIEALAQPARLLRVKRRLPGAPPGSRRRWNGEHREIGKLRVAEPAPGHSVPVP